MVTKQQRAANQKKYRDRARAAGLCVRNAKHGAAAPKRSCCQGCLDYMAMRFNVRVPPAERPPLPAPKQQVGGCIECGRYEPMSWTTICWVCANQAARAA